MQMIPSTPHRTNSNAEKRVFDLLRGITSLSLGSFTVYHSLNLTQHAYKRFGEIDFVLCGQKGLYVLEVKGGRIMCEKGVWHYIDRYNQTHRANESPFKQAESALHGLLSVLRKQIPIGKINNFHIGYGVIFPDFVWEANGAEWDRHVLADARDVRGFERWLENMIRHWHQKDPRSREPDKEDINAIKTYLRPEFEAAIPLHVQTERINEEVSRLTEEQMNMLDIVDANPRVLCSGGAGTGKTFLAMELAQRWTAEGQKVLLTCYSPCLKRFLESRFKVPGLTVSLYSGIKTAARISGINKFDALIVDEGQDLLNWNCLEIIDRHLKSGLEGGNWCFFHDVNNQAGLFGPIDKEALSFLESCQPTRIPLRKNCRNTRLIVDKVKSMLGADMGVVGIGEGPEVRQEIVGSNTAAIRTLQEEIHTIIEKGGLSFSELTILSGLPFLESSASQISDKILNHVVVLDEFSFRSFPPEKISFCEIRNFKGLENEAIIVVDLPKPNKTSEPKPNYYVAMSRARALLSLIFRNE